MADKEEIEKTKEEIEETMKVPDEWAEIPFQNFFDKGYRPWIQKQKKRGKSYIALKKGDDVKTIGPYSKDKWNLLVEMYPYPLPQLSPDSPPIDERIAELKKEKLGKRMIAQTLYNEGYSTKEMMHYGYSPNLLHPAGVRSKEKLSEESIQIAIRGATKGPGYLQELKNMVQKDVRLSSNFASACTNAGVQVVLSALKRTELKPEEVKKVFSDPENLIEIVNQATETALKALKYYDVERIKQLEEERREARVAYSIAMAQLRALQRRFEPKKTLERLIYAYIVSGNTDGNVLAVLIERLLAMKMSKLQSGVFGD